jgi:UDP-N-acetylglucosamine 1-carboxyvinyltransferase
MGAKISGDGSSTLEIIGVEALSGATHTVMGDRIEAGTFLIAGLITGGAVAVRGVLAEEMESTLQALERMGAVIERSSTAIVAHSPAKPLRGIEISTQPFPGFPTDMQAQLMVLLTQAQGHSLITETIFENRFMHVPELGRLGAEIQIRGNRALIEGPKCLKGAPLMATDLRASASLVLGALAAEGESVIHRVYHLDRGYEQMESKLRDLGAEVERIS